MLNRNAESLFWVGRYMERAENHARLIDVHYHLQSEADHSAADTEELQQRAAQRWIRIVDALGCRSIYEQRYSGYTENDVLYYVTHDREHANSLISCIQHARGNLRTLREKVPTEMWDAINTFYLWLRDKRQEELSGESPHQFYIRIKEWTALFLGISQSVMPRENEWYFIECGRYLERAENTLRIIQSAVGAGGAEEQSSYSYLQALLKSVSGYQVFRRYYADGVSVEAINEFLVLHPAFPRSVHFSLLEMHRHLSGIQFQDAQLKANHARMIRQAGRMIAELSCMEREDIGNGGEIVGELLEDCQELGVAFAKTFFRLGEASA